MSKSRPVGGNNAIDAAAFVLGFSRPLNQRECEALIQLREHFAKELPSFSKVADIQVQFTGGPGEAVATAQRETVAGILLQRFQENGKLEWALRAAGDRIVVQCSKYSSWGEVWPRARGFLLSAVRAVQAQDNACVVAALQFVDKFEYEGVPTDYELGEVFRASSRYLTEQATRAGNAWHVYQGWFDAGPVLRGYRGRVLHNLNLQSAEFNGQLVATVDHLQQYVFTEKAAPISALLEADGTGTADALLNVLFPNLHAWNVNIVRDLLSDSKLREIGLT